MDVTPAIALPTSTPEWIQQSFRLYRGESRILSETSVGVRYDQNSYVPGGCVVTITNGQKISQELVTWEGLPLGLDLMLYLSLPAPSDERCDLVLVRLSRIDTKLGMKFSLKTSEYAVVKDTLLTMKFDGVAMVADDFEHKKSTAYSQIKVSNGVNSDQQWIQTGGTVSFVFDLYEIQCSTDLSGSVASCLVSPH